MADPERDERRVVVEWGVRASLVEYLRRMPDFTVRAEGGAELAGDVVRLPAVQRADGTIRATGAIELSGHGGALRLPLHGVVVADGALWIDDPLEELAARRLVLLSRIDAATFETRLAAESDVLFLYNYVPDVPFGTLCVRDG